MIIGEFYPVSPEFAYFLSVKMNLEDIDVPDNKYKCSGRQISPVYLIRCERRNFGEGDISGGQGDHSFLKEIN